MFYSKSSRLWIFSLLLVLLVACTRTPSIVLNPTQVSPGDEVTATLSNYEGSSATVTVADNQAEVIEKGKSKVVFVIPANTPSGSRKVVVASNGKQASANLTIVEPEPDAQLDPWAEPGEEVQIDLEGITITEPESISTTATNAEDIEIVFEGESVDFSVIDANTIAFKVPSDTDFGTKDVVIKTAESEFPKQINIPGGDLLDGKAMFIVKPGIARAGLSSKLNGLGLELMTFDGLGSNDSESICSGSLATISYNQDDKRLGEVIRELIENLESELFELEKLSYVPDNLPVRVIDPMSGYGVRPAEHLDTIGATRAQTERGLSGEGVTIAVLDTGVSNHPKLVGRLLNGQDFVDNDDNPEDTFDDKSTTFAGDGHGTAVAILAAGSDLGVAPKAKVLPARVCNDDGKCETSHVVRGMCYALTHPEVDPANLVINLSLGGNTPPFLSEIVMFEALSKNVLIAAAAGNEGEEGSPKHYPAAYNLNGVVVAAALDETNTKAASFSNSGTYIDVAAPGVGLESGTPNGLTFDGFKGTSFSSALAAGALALWREAKPDADPSSIEEGIRSSAKVLTGSELSIGEGLLDLSEQPRKGNAPPLITSFDFSPSPALLGELVTFSWEVSDLDGDDLTCTLKFGDGSADVTIDNCESDTMRQYTYESAGDYTAELSATDGAETIADSETVSVVEIPPPGDECNDGENDTTDTACALVLGTTYGGKINPGGDLEYFRLETTEDGILEMNLSSVPSDLSMKIQLRNRFNNSIITDTSLGAPGEPRYQELLLGAGTYFIRLEGNGASNGSYTFRATLDTDDSNEINNGSGQATEISVGQEVEGIIRPDGDIDYFRVLTSEAGIFEVNLSSVPSDLAMKVQLRNRFDNSIIAEDSLGAPGEARYLEALIDAGTYFIRFEGSGVSEEFYTFTTNLNTDDPNELNNSASQAKEISVGQDVKGVIRPDGDNDYFLIRLDEDATIKIDLSSVPSDLSMKIQLINRFNSVVIKETSFGAPGEARSLTTDEPLSAAGSPYFILIQGNGTSKGIYTLTTTKQ